MGARKRISAAQRTQAKKGLTGARLRAVPSSPRKMRLVTGSIKGQGVADALAILKYSKREAAKRVEKLLLSAMANWQRKNAETSIEAADLFVKEIRVDGAKTLKRIRPAPQGRAHRIRKRSNHITLILGARKAAETDS
ncbi:MAG: 50S ribosomal protein L22 [Flavobacteriales bacterium]